MQATPNALKASINAAILEASTVSLRTHFRIPEIISEVRIPSPLSLKQQSKIRMTIQCRTGSTLDVVAPISG